MNNQETTPPAKKINLKLNVDEVNLVLKALGNLPFNEVFELIGTIHDQANAQSHDNG